MKINMKTAAMIGLVLCLISSPAAAQLADSPWSMFHHDLNHTGLSTHYGPDTSTVKWIFPTGDKIHGSPVIGDDGTVYIGTHGRHSTTTGSKLFAIYPNGTEKWQWNPGHSIDSTPAVAQDGTLYVGCWDKSLYAINPDGTVKWEFSDPGRSFVYTSPAIAPDGTIYTGNNNNRLYAINPDGTLKWSYKTHGAIHSSPAVDADGTVYIGSHDKKLYAINPDGTLKWKYWTGRWIESSPAIGTDGTIYVGSYDKKLHAINPDGTLKWKYLTGGRIRSSPAIGADGTIYVGSSYDKKLHAINPDGTLKWDYTTNSYILSSPAIDADGTIYVGSFDRNLYAINPDGSLLWKYNTGDRIDYSSPAIASDGTIYIGNWNGYVYAFGPGVQSNLSPVLDPIGDRTLNETETVMIDVNATDPDGDPLYFSCNRTDLFTNFDPATGTGNWTPGYGDAGTYLVDFGVSDGEGGIDNETIEITVLDANRPPVLDQIGNMAINENSLLEFTINATDPDGNVLTYSASNLPDGAIFNPNTRTFSWTPSFVQSGTYPDIQFKVSDGELIDPENITITVKNTNRPPVLDLIGDRTVNETHLLEFTINATDPDGDVLTYTASNLPDGAAFNPNTRTFSWTPTFEQAGSYPDVHFEVSDGELTGMENITITVDNTNRPPVLDHIGDKTVNETDLLEFTINAADPDADVLTYTASNLPDGAAFNPNTRTFSWTPTFGQSGTYPDVHFAIGDGEFTDWENITITVNRTNRPPVLNQIGDKTVDENTLLEFIVDATDPDGDTLTYSASNLPDGAVFNPNTRTFSWTPAFDQSGTYPDVHFEVSDGELTGLENITITVNNTNRPPVLDHIGDRTVSESNLLEFTINAVDPDGDALAYTAPNLPDGATFDPHTRTFSWTPAFDQSGTYPDVHFEVSDSELDDQENIIISVSNTNRPPVLDQIGDMIINESDLLEFTVNATDPDGNTLAYTASNLPAGAVFDPGTRIFSWTPAFGQSGTYLDVHFEVSDGELGDQENITISVNSTNRPPVLDHIGDRTVNENNLLEFTVNATDQDNDVLSYSASNLPDGAVFDPNTRTFSWTPTFSQSGTYLDVHFEVSDGELTDREYITITVNNTNRPPVLDQIGNKPIDENSLLEFTVNATDPDGDVLVYSASNLPDGAAFDPGTRTFSWTPTFNQSGSYLDVHFEVSDGEFTDMEHITITVNEANRPPVLDQIEDKTIDENSLLEFTVNATDPDGDVLVYSTSNLPAGAAFNPGTKTFSWTPTFSQSGPYPDVHFEVSDGGSTDWVNITITVNNMNRPPVLDQIGDRTIGENSLLEFAVNATDPDGDVLVYSASNLPAGATFNPNTKTFSWTPTIGQSGTYPDVYFEIGDGESTDWENITIVVDNVKRPPVLDQIGDRTINEDSSLEFTINASDPDGDALTYSASNLPDGAAFNPTTQTFSWTPTFGQSGTYPDVHFETSDGELTDWENITISVNNTNRPPVLDPIGDWTINENSSLEFMVNASDPDGDVLAYSASNLPDGAAFNPHTRTFSWTPTFDQSGTYPDVYFEIGDGESTDWVNITITVNNTNRPPVLDQIGDRIIYENCSLEFIVNASDPDGDALTYSAFNLPNGAAFNPTTQTFSWTPTLSQSGIYPDVYFEVSDGELTGWENITIRVVDADTSPEIRIIVPDSEVMFQQQFTINVTVDPMMTEIYGVQYVLAFDNSVLHAEWQNEGTFLDHDGAVTNVYINTIDNGAGTISFAATRVDVTTGVTAPGTLAVIKFTAIQKGICSDLTLDGVIVANENGDEIDPVVIINSSICVDENQPPAAVGKSMHRYNNEGEKYLCKVYFDGAGSIDPDGSLVNWRWSYGDGNYGAGELVDHVYQSWKWNGTGYAPFTAVLTVTDDGDPHQLDDTTSFDVIVYTAGDANGDGKVNILDATIIGLEWGGTTTCEEYCWEGQERADQADLNNDCKVNILDAVIIGTCWGHTAW
jgi:outer membrane protein assembly factor BamB